MSTNKIQKVRQVIESKICEYYFGSLDFPCDFCGHNSYENFHLINGFERTGKIEFIICETCLGNAKRLAIGKDLDLNKESDGGDDGKS